MVPFSMDLFVLVKDTQQIFFELFCYFLDVVACRLATATGAVRHPCLREMLVLKIPNCY